MCVVGTKMPKHFYLQPHKSCLYVYICQRTRSIRKKCCNAQTLHEGKTDSPIVCVFEDIERHRLIIGIRHGRRKRGDGGTRHRQWEIRRGRPQTTGSRSQASRVNTSGRDAEPRKFETTPRPENHPDSGSGSGSEQDVLTAPAPVPAWAPGKMYRVRRLRLQGCEVQGWKKLSICRSNR